MALAVDIGLIGDKELLAKFARLTDKKQLSSMRGELKKSNNRLKKKIIAKAATLNKDTTPDDKKVHTVSLVDALKATKVVSSRLARTRRFGFISSVFKAPSREAYGLPAGYEWYPPWSVEYGYTRTGRNPVVVPAQSYIRSTVNEHGAAELRKMNAGLAKKIEKAFASGRGVR